MRRTSTARLLLAVTGLSVSLTTTAFAVPYASGVRNTTGTTWEFILNESSSDVSITRNGGNVLNLGALAAGRHTFDMSTFTNFDIKVTKSAPTAWTWTNPTSPLLWDDFERPTGMAVNSVPGNLAYFGTIYVNNSGNSAISQTNHNTATGRQMGDGVYPLTADLVGVDMLTFAALTNANDMTQAKAPGWNVGQSAALAGTNSAWRLGLDEAGNVLAADWSDNNGGIKWASQNLTTGGALLNTQSGPTLGVPHPISGEYMHGSIVSKPVATGSVGNNLVVYAVDEDLESSLGAGDGDNLWRWNVGSATNYDGIPTLVADTGAMVSNDVNMSNTDTANVPWTLNAGGNFADIEKGAQPNRWYLSGASTFGHDQSSLLVIDTSAAPAKVLWSSRQFSLDKGLDGMTSSTAPESTGINDILREAWAMKLSKDGTKLYVGLSKVYNEATDKNTYIGPASGTHVPNAILIIPLDAQGLPNIQVNDNGTPGNTVDDFITNIQTIPLSLPASGNLDRINLDVDAAGNVYVVNNITERLDVFSPGGNTIATTSFNGTVGSFNVTTAAGILGDFDNDGDVDSADYVKWRNQDTFASLPNDNGAVNAQGQYDVWKANFGKPPAAGSTIDGSVNVPEPAGILLAMLGLFAVGVIRRR